MEHFIAGHPFLFWFGSGFLTWLVMFAWKCISIFRNHGITYDNSNVRDFPEGFFLMWFILLGPIPGCIALVVGAFWLDLIIIAAIGIILGFTLRYLLCCIGLKSLSAKILPGW